MPTRPTRSPLRAAFLASLVALLSHAPLAPANDMAKQAKGPESSDRLAKLAWIAGVWRGTQAGARIEEHWMAADGGLMLGVSRTVAGGKAVAFEFLRIEARGNDVFYVAQPQGRPPTDFRLTSVEGQVAVFENPAHDHPKLIRYELRSDGALVARVEGDEKGKRTAQEFIFQRRPSD